MLAVTAMKLGAQDYIPKKSATASVLRRTVEHTARNTQLLKKMDKYRRDLERSNHDLELFANIVAHDLKSPLRAIKQHLTLIRDRVEGRLDDKSQRSLEFAVEGAQRMHTLIDTLFTYAKLGFSTPELARVNMTAVLGMVERDLSACIEESGAQISSDVLPEVEGDVTLLSQLLQNLITNAIKYCKAVPRIHVSATREDDRWRISVTDNGIGIAPSQHDNIFAIFRRLHSGDEYPGVGLGLAVCDRIVKQHGGKIWVESAPGKGSTFHFTVPALTAAAQKKVAYG